MRTCVRVHTNTHTQPHMHGGWGEEERDSQMNSLLSTSVDPGLTEEIMTLAKVMSQMLD